MRIEEGESERVGVPYLCLPLPPIKVTARVCEFVGWCECVETKLEDEGREDQTRRGGRVKKEEKGGRVLSLSLAGVGTRTTGAL